jgi:hypothetical protein
LTLLNRILNDDHGLGVTVVSPNAAEGLYDHATLRRQPAAVPFQAEHSNDCWQFDLSPPDLRAATYSGMLRSLNLSKEFYRFEFVDDHLKSYYAIEKPE